MPNFVIIDDYKIDKNKHKKTFRDTSKFNKHDFNAEIGQIKLSTSDDVNIVFDNFQEQYLKILDKHAPWKIQSNKDLKWSLKPWFTKGLRKSIKIKDRYYGKFMRTKRKHWYELYRKYRNSIKRLTFLSKKNYYKS